MHKLSPSKQAFKAKKAADKKKLVGEALQGLSGLLKGKPLSKPGTNDLDIAALNDLPEVKFLVNNLKKLGVSRKWLMDEGFMVAGMVLNFK